MRLLKNLLLFAVFALLPPLGLAAPHGFAANAAQTQGLIAAQPSFADVLIARPTASVVFVDGERIAFEAYNINGNNYFKLRDLAYALSGTEKQFAVGWDSAAKCIALTSGMPYTPIGGEMTGKGAGNKAPTAATSRITLDGAAIDFTAYNIEGNNYAAVK
jgi:hypothetical protein